MGMVRDRGPSPIFLFLILRELRERAEEPTH
jgi:hypothetical protein